ncbi:MAG: class I SAM-dependent methyltransferase [Solirubrobacteraceae bacterium]
MVRGVRTPTAPGPRHAAAAALAALLGAALWWRRHPSACPYGQRFFVEAPHPFITRRRLHEVLEAQPGERLLEVGPGTGYYTLEVAERLGADGRLDILDVQQEMLDHTMRAAGRRRLANLHPLQGDATSLPYPDAAFDAAYLVTVLGEIPDQAAALRELRRVLRPSGRLVVGEVLLDPHVVTFSRLRERAQAAGLRHQRHSGGRLGYFARFVPA